MAAGLCDIQHEKLADLLAELRKLTLVQRKQILPRVDLTYKIQKLHNLSNSSLIFCFSPAKR